MRTTKSAAAGRVRTARLAVMATCLLAWPVRLCYAETGDAQYEEALSVTKQAVDQGQIAAFYAQSWVRLVSRRTPRSAAEAGLSAIYLDFLRMHGNVPSDNHEEIRRYPIELALRAAVKEDASSAYPVAIYAWFVSQFREHGLRPGPIVKELDPQTYTDSQGRSRVMYRELFVGDPARDRRVSELLKQASSIDRKNPLVLFLRGRLTKDPVERRRLFWASLGSPGSRLWEFGALNALRRQAKGDADELQRIRDWTNKAKAIVGDSPRAKAHRF